MKRGTIKIKGNNVAIEAISDNVMMAKYEIAELFGVFISSVTSNINSILKSGVLKENEVCFCHKYDNGNQTEFYSLEMITALAFRIKSKNAEIFRKWLISEAVDSSKLHKMLVFRQSNCLN